MDSYEVPSSRFPSVPVLDSERLFVYESSGSIHLRLSASQQEGYEGRFLLLSADSRWMRSTVRLAASIG
jgi:hypothetical protein